ncbi:hypothetical protein SH580_10005 [Coraliomargarita algicola]|uniref:Tetratricopeptide repeat protein n=1 Tax=Coraliomargarita algicola TaxID=3092156 RepID=A0ABZ0RS09_9BACT|nr:hypothetical protein [Coraliomargarita sp. J2-16]WPJ98034.1 hypothetical protein SH580_10005 [Coraliomargarita sp. J2-16]
MKLSHITHNRSLSNAASIREPGDCRLCELGVLGVGASLVKTASLGLFLGVFLFACFMPSFLAAKPEIQMRLQYPQQMKDVILTGIDGDEIVFRPLGRDDGGRAYLKFDELVRKRGTLNFLFPQAFYDAIEALEAGHSLQALPVIRESAKPFIEYLELSHLPGNMLPTVLSYLDALIAAGQWREASEVATQMPLQLAPPRVLERVGKLALALSDAGQASALDRVHQYILSARQLSEAHLAVALDLANAWRERGDYMRAFNLYRKVQVADNLYQTRARLWVAYCSFYLGHDLVPSVFLENLPEMDVTTPGYSLRELIKARLSLRDEDLSAAMRSAAEGKTYASSTDPWYPELLYTVATVYARIDMKQAAIAAYRELTISFPESPWAATSRKDLEVLTTEVPEL